MADDLKGLFGVPYARLRGAQGIQELDQAFLGWLKNKHSQRAAELLSFRESEWPDLQYENWLLDFAPCVAEFLAEGFGVQKSLQVFFDKALRDRVVYQFQAACLKKLKHKAREWEPVTYEAATQAIEFMGFLSAEDPEYALARCWGSATESEKEALQDWCMAALGQKAVADWVIFKLPENLDLKELIKTDRRDGSRSIEGDKRRLRQGFDLTDPGMSENEKQNEAHYCVYCHDKSGDFCSRGFPVKKGQAEKQWRTHITGELMLGCPVEEKISQMHKLYAEGDLLAAFAVVMADNPLCALTGHRICNDCMKSCIYQKKSPVNTPEVETGVVMDVLQLPWGVEIYDILMRWNPLRRTQAVEQLYTGKNVWVMGLGPAGISVTHHLLMAGCGVVAADGLRIQPLPQAWCEGPIKDLGKIWEPLSTRPVRGFGGVAEYGITVRWNKNFLTLIQLLFQRRPNLLMFGDTRFGGTVSVEDAWKLGFDHLCLAVGAGLPRELRIPGSLAPGMRQANDFLMALQLTEVGRKGSVSALQLRLPAIVIGGGLTGVDTATEAQAYYIQQIKQVERWFLKLVGHCGEEKAWTFFDAVDRERIEEWLSHAKAWRQYQAENEVVDTASFLQRYGGVSIVYRKRLEDSPAYRYNHEELQKALQEGVRYRECLEPVAAVCDGSGAVKAMRFSRQEKTEQGWHATDDEITMPVRSVLCATGSSPNVAYEFEHSGTFLKQRKMYAPYRFVDDHLILEQREDGHCKSDQIGMLTSYDDGEHRVSLLGDAHPWFNGSVVKAVASGKVALPQILASMRVGLQKGGFQELKASIEEQFATHLQSIDKVTDTVTQWVVHAPWLVKKHKTGQFYRVGQRIDPKAEPVAMLAAIDPKHPDCLVFWIKNSILEKALLSQIEVGSQLSVMGPTGAYTSMRPENKCIVVIGSVLAAIYLRSVAPSWKEQGCRVVWINTSGEQFSDEQLLSFVDEVTDKDFTQAVLDYADVTAIHVIGDKALLCEVQFARANQWKGKLSDSIHWIGSTYGPMQCMLKGVCAQCLQWQLDPKTGERKKAVYACSWQHQPMDLIDLSHLGQRQRLKSTHEKLARLAG